MHRSFRSTFPKWSSSVRRGRKNGEQISETAENSLKEKKRGSLSYVSTQDFAPATLQHLGLLRSHLPDLFTVSVWWVAVFFWLPSCLGELSKKIPPMSGGARQTFLRLPGWKLLGFLLFQRCYWPDTLSNANTFWYTVTPPDSFLEKEEEAEALQNPNPLYRHLFTPLRKNTKTNLQMLREREREREPGNPTELAVWVKRPPNKVSAPLNWPIKRAPGFIKKKKKANPSPYEKCGMKELLFSHCFGGLGNAACLIWFPPWIHRCPCSIRRLEYKMFTNERPLVNSHGDDGKSVRR